MDVEFDPDKDAANLLKHRISLARVVEMNVLSVSPDIRFDYGEDRFRAFGMIDGRGYCLCFTMRTDRIRAISLRRARRKEIDRHEPGR